MSTDKFRFLFLLYYWPPVQGTAAKRNFRIAKAISDRVDQARVFTATENALSFENPSHHVEKVSVLDYRRLVRRKTKDGALPESKKSSAIAQFFIRLINTFPFNIIAGEGGLIYFIHLLVKGNKHIKKHKITHLYSSYRPFADHYAAYWLKKRNPGICWIADFRDLVIDPHYRHIFFSKKHHTFFSKIFQKANVLTTVSDGLADKLKTYNPNVVTLRNGIGKNWQIPQPKPSGHFTIVYSGSMFLDKRNAEPLFKAVQELFQETKFEAQDIKITYAGKDGQQWRHLAKAYRFESIFEDKGILSNEAARTLQEHACINVLLTISSEELQGVLTGKMIEYFEAGVPVLGIVMNQNDPELSSLLKDLEIGTSFSDDDIDIEGIKDFLWKEYSYWKKTNTNRIAVSEDKLRKQFAMSSVMQSLFEQLKLN